jgi:hypothetical protein
MRLHSSIVKEVPIPPEYKDRVAEKRTELISALAEVCNLVVVWGWVLMYFYF